MPVSVDDRGDFRGLDFGAASPKHIGVSDGDAFGFEMAINGGLVLQDEIFFGAMHHPHDVDVSELRAAFSPVAMSHTVVASNLCAGFDFPTGGDCPVEESIEASDALSAFRWFDMLKEGGKATNDFFPIKLLGNFKESFEADSGTCRT